MEHDVLGTGRGLRPSSRPAREDAVGADHGWRVAQASGVRARAGGSFAERRRVRPVLAQALPALSATTPGLRAAADGLPAIGRDPISVCGIRASDEREPPARVRRQAGPDPQTVSCWLLPEKVPGWGPSRSIRLGNNYDANAQPTKVRCTSQLSASSVKYD